MEKDRKIKIVSFIAIIVAIVCLSTAFAAMSTALKINGTATFDPAKWSIYFNNLSEAKIIGGAKEVTKPVINNKTTIEDVNVILYNPRDEITYNVDLINDGNIDAQISDIIMPTLTKEQEKYLSVELVYDNGSLVSKGDVLQRMTLKNMNLKIKFKDDLDASDLPKTSEKIKISCQITFVQADNKEISSNVTTIKPEGHASDLYPGDITNNGMYDGSETNPYQIESIEDLVQFSNDVSDGNNYSNKFIKLATDLDFQKTGSYVDSKTTEFGDVNEDGKQDALITELTTEKGFDPIGTSTNTFNGNLNGNNKSISNLYINRSNEEYVGLFASSSATITNLTLNNASIKGNNYVGTLAGQSLGTNMNVELNNIYVSGNDNIGGLSGYASGNLISNIDVTGGKVSGSNYVGGISGRNYSKVLHSNTKILSSTVNIDVDGSSNVGGVLGFSDVTQSSNTVRAMYLGGNITASSNYGRIQGGGNTDILGYAVSNKSLINGSAVSSNYANTINGLDVDSLDEVMSDINLADMAFDTYIGGDNDGDGYVLDYGKSGKLEKVEAITPKFSSGNGSKENPYIISTKEDMKKASYDLSKSYKLGNDIDMNGEKYYMIGNLSHGFTGIFDGGNYTINNIVIDEPKMQYVGMFGNATATIKNLNISNISVTGYQDVGSITGFATGDNIISYVNIYDGKITGKESIGGIAGANYSKVYNGNTKIYNSTARINVEGETNVGGILGSSTVSESSNVVRAVYLGGNITASSNYGRIQGSGNNNVKAFAIASNSYVNGKTITSDYANTLNGMDVDSLDEVMSDINLADMAFDTYIGGDNDGDGYVLDYGKSGKLEKVEAITPKFSSGDGSKENPYIISTKEDMKKASYDLSKSYKLGNDIDMNGEKYYMIGNLDKSYTGVFDGNNYTISNITIDEPKMQYVGMFGCTTSTIKDLNISNINVKGYQDVGGLVGYSSGDNLILNINVKNGDIQGNQYIGGVAGRVLARIYGSTRLLNSKVEVNIIGNKNVGGVLGFSDTLYESNTIRAVYLGGSITASSNYGRIQGGGSNNTRGFAIASKSFVNGKIISSNQVDTINGLDVDSLDEVMSDINLADMAFDTYIGGDNDGDGYVLDYGKSGKLEKVEAITPKFSSGNGSKENPYIISTKEDMKKASYDLSKSYKLGNDIDMNGEKYYMIGNFDKSYTGVFDGNNYTISNITIDDPKMQYVGMFGKVTNTIKKLKVKNVNVTGNKYVGGISGVGGTIMDVDVKSTITGNNYVGGISGFSTTVKHSNADSVVTGDTNVAGIVGYNGYIYSSTASVKVSGNDCVGGALGSSDGGSAGISGVVISGDIEGKNNVGGISGFSNRSVDTIGVYSQGNVTAS